MNTPIVEAKGLVKRFRKKERPAVDRVDLSFGAGEIVAVVGHNGAGKSTLFDMLGGLLAPTEGSVRIGVERAQIGWCPQREIVDWSLTVRQNIALGLELRRPELRRETRSSVEEVATALGLGDHLDHTAETLSGGELRRTQIARAMAGDPSLMILDEPTTGLDPEGIGVVFNYLDSRRSGGASALISTHETSRFSTHCTRVLAMAEGRIIADLSVSDFLSLSPVPSQDLWEAYRALREGAE